VVSGAASFENTIAMGMKIGVRAEVALPMYAAAAAADSSKSGKEALETREEEGLRWRRRKSLASCRRLLLELTSCRIYL
jgi:hypothetical protein